MTPRRLGLLMSLAALAALGPRFARAQGMAKQEAMPVFQSEGRNPITFAVACATATWTVVIASDTIARSTFIESISSNTASICLLPIASATVPTVAISSQCVPQTQGTELPPNSALTDYNRSGWACIASSGTATQYLKGYRTRDKGDIGYIGAPGLQ